MRARQTALLAAAVARRESPPADIWIPRCASVPPMKRRHGRFPVLRALLGGALAVGACGDAEDPTNVSVTIGPTVSHQTLVGFGAATAYQADLLSGRTDDIYQVLFVDSGLDILRLGELVSEPELDQHHAGHPVLRRRLRSRSSRRPPQPAEERLPRS